MPYPTTKYLLLTEQKNWIEKTLAQQDLALTDITPLAEHADTRRYLRLHTTQNSIICLQTTGPHNLTGFIDATLCLSEQHVPTPTILAHSIPLGLVLLSDLGDNTLLKTLRQSPQKKIFWYEKALLLLQDIQKAEYPTPKPDYDSILARKNAQLCPEWFCEKLLHAPFTAQEKALWEDCLAILLQDWNNMPTTLCHRDFHADNIMVTTQAQQSNLHILDYQDLSTGPYLYDVVSLTTDHYLPLDQTMIAHILAQYHEQHANTFGRIDNYHQRHWHDCLALQRHLKNLGVFARLTLKSKKKQYLQHIPRMLHHMLLLSKESKPLQALTAVLSKKWAGIHYKKINTSPENW
jgi:aminoglycoside/choline kinase family phosphotransferase